MACWRSKMVAGLVACHQLLACSWTPPIWSKSKRSGTPLFRFVTEKGAGYIDRQGKVAIPPQYNLPLLRSADFFDGLAYTGNTYIDAKGNPVMPAQPSTRGGDFSEGLADWWFDKRKKYGFIGRDGKTAIPGRFDEAGSFRDGLARVAIGGLFGYIDHSGAMAIPAKFPWATDFSGGHAFVIEDGPCHRVGYEPCDSFNGPYSVPAAAGGSSGKSQLPRRCSYSILNTSGHVIATPYVDASPFSERLAAVGDGKRWGYADASGILKIALQFDYAEPFSEGLAAVGVGGNVGFIDERGALVISGGYWYSGNFSEGLAWVREDNKYWFIDKTGKRAFAGDFADAGNFAMGLAHVRLGATRFGYLDKTGRVVFRYSRHLAEPAEPAGPPCS